MGAEVQNTRFGRLMQAAFNLKQRLTLGETLPDVMATFPISNREAQPELEVHAGVDFCRAYALTANVAAQVPSVLFSNPAGSGKVATIDEMVFTGGGGNLFLSMGGAGAAAATLPSYTDFRRAQQGRPTCRLQTLSAAAATPAVAMWAQGMVNGVAVYFAGPIVLTPGGSLWAEHSTVNTSLYGSFRWRERVLEPGELIL